MYDSPSDFPLYTKTYTPLGPVQEGTVSVDKIDPTIVALQDQMKQLADTVSKFSVNNTEQSFGNLPFV